MLCRALVTAIAISCTFSREVIGQGTRPNVHKKDLICVLWLSGLQKEDLDVNILRKLHRHDVNIDDMDNDTTLHHDCLQRQIFKQNKSSKETSTRDTVGNQTKVVFTKIKGRSNIKQIVTSDLNVLLANLINNDQIKRSDTNKTFSGVESRTSKTLEENTSTKKSQTSYVDEEVTLTSPFDTTGSPINLVKRDRKQNLQEVINFWKMFKTTHIPLDLFESTTQKQQMRSTTIKDWKQTVINVDNEDKQAIPEYIDKLLADYYNHKFPDTLQATTTPPIDFKKLSQQIETLLEIVSQSEKYNRSNINTNKFQKNDESKIKLVEDMLPWKYQFTDDIPPKSSLQSERLRQYNVYQPKLEDNYYTRNTDLSYDSSKTKSIQFDYPYVTQDPVKDYRQTYKQSLNYENLLENEGVTKSPKENLNRTDDVKVLSRDVMKEIADNIKTLVLKDLAQIITTKSTTPLSTTIITTTAITKTTTQHSINSTELTTTATRNHKTQLNKNEDPTHVMEKFINLFEQFKTMKDKRIVTGQMKVNILEERTLRPDYTNPLSINNRAPILVVNSRVKASLSNQPMLYSPLGIQNIPVKKVKFINLPITSASVLEVHPALSQKKGVPIMMQTNSGEIAPLGIPISKPLKLIHQNILVTTMRPIDLYKKQSDPLIGAFGAYNHETNLQNPTKTFKDMLHKHSIVINQSGQLKSDRLLELKSYREIPKQQEQRSYQNNRLKNDRVSNHQTRLEDETPRLSEQRSYRNARIRNREDSRRPPRFEDEQPKIMQQMLYKTPRNKNLEDSYRSSRFEDQRKLQGQNPFYKTATMKKQEEDNYPLIYNDETLKLLQQSSYKSLSIGNQEDYPRYLSTRIEYDKLKSNKNSGMTNEEDNLFSSRYKNENLKSRDQTRTKTIRIVNNDDGYRPRAFDNEKLKLLEQSRNKNQEINNRPLYFDDESTKQMEQRLYKSERIRNNEESSHQSHFDDERTKQVEPKTYKSARIQNGEDVRPTRLEDIQEYEKLNRDNMDKIKAYEGEIKFPGDKISYGSFRNHDREKFHEKLERVDDWRDEQDDRTDKKQLTFSARQQRPLNDVKKISTYDDTHFNEFLKTQQKVNDMLEKILATKTGRTGPHSTESI